MQRYLLPIIMALMATVAAADPYPEVADYVLDVRFTPAASSLEGTAAIRFRAGSFPLATTTFYLHGELRVRSLRIGDRELDFSQDQVRYDFDYSMVATEIRCDLADLRPDERLTVEYAGHFHPSKARAPSNYMRVDAGGVFLRSYGYSLWFPVFLPSNHDERFVDFSSVTLITPADMPAVLTGEWLGERFEGDHRISEWRAENVSVFEAQCSARRWEVMDADPIRIYHLPDPESRERAAGIMAFARQAVAYFETSYGVGTGTATTYIMQMPEYGDISSGNVSGISDRSWGEFDGGWASKYLLAHELVHPYTGRQIPRDDPLWCFVVEGFPSYFHLPFLAEALGDEWYRDRIRTVEQRYLKKRETGLSRRGRPLPPEKPIDRIGADELGDWKDTFVLNDRVVLFWDYIRREMGVEAFAQLSRRLFAQPTLTADTILQVIRTAYPGADETIDTWLSTTEFPDWMRVDGD